MQKQNIQNILLKWKIRMGKQWKKTLSLAEKRLSMDERGRLHFPNDVNVQQIAMRGIPALRLTPPDEAGNWAICYFHGGGYVSGSMHSHLTLCATLAKLLQATVVIPDYALAPESPFPGAVSDAVSGLEWMHVEFAKQQVIVMGDSAGGGLAMAAMLKLREEALPLPALAILLAPWLDLTLSDPSIPKIARHDPVLTRKGLLEDARKYHREHDPQNPFISPIFAPDFKGFPPTLIQVGTHDLLLSDSQRLAKKLRESGVQVSLEEWKKMIHVWQVQLGAIPEAQESIVRIGEYVRSHLPKKV